IREIALLFASRRNVLSASVLKNRLRFLSPVAVIGMDGEQYIPALDPTFIALRFILGNAHADQSPRDSTDHAACADSCQSPNDRSSRDQRPYARDSQASDSSKPAERSTDYAAGDDPGSGPLG